MLLPWFGAIDAAHFDWKQKTKLKIIITFDADSLHGIGRQMRDCTEKEINKITTNVERTKVQKSRHVKLFSSTGRRKPDRKRSVYTASVNWRFTITQASTTLLQIQCFSFLRVFSEERHETTFADSGLFTNGFIAHESVTGEWVNVARFRLNQLTRF